jgi:hypothetical protein
MTVGSIPIKIANDIYARKCVVVLNHEKIAFMLKNEIIEKNIDQIHIITDVFL